MTRGGASGRDARPSDSDVGSGRDAIKPGGGEKRETLSTAVIDQRRERVSTAMTAMAAWRARRDGGQYVRATPRGTVTVDSMETGETEDGTAYIDVFLPGSTSAGDPHYRIINPPTLVLDSSGPVERGKLRYRVEPLAAIAEAIALHGGAQPEGGRR